MVAHHAYSFYHGRLQAVGRTTILQLHSMTDLCNIIQFVIPDFEYSLFTYL